MRDHAMQLLYDVEKAINQRSLSALADCFAEQAMLVNILGQRLYGREQICDYLASNFLLLHDKCLNYRLVHGFGLNDDNAILNVQKMCTDRSDNTQTGITTAPLWVITRTKERWRIIASNTM
ncbi:hypothetical protein AT746_12305 [Lacimicrobium alkaliphilum]|uniref:DUF4440 domain-containing protein n=2 Tax=Lacimicrobium alkaliphilum TaxID=1526571 RepID=A0A0U2PHG7_9ALTE|nr:hypothetical protein AT746_12305 [Lacimicrobium alkaliphilum]